MTRQRSDLRNLQRLSVFKDCCTRDDEQLGQVLDEARETPESNRVVTKFVDRVLLEGS